MAKILSFLSWNLENFHNDASRVNRVVDAISAKNPDVFGIYEVKGAQVFSAMVNKMPGYTFTITESESVPEILIGIKSTLTAFVTQKNELNSKVPSLRPGALATITKNGQHYPFLFLHLKSFSAPRDWGLRDDMFSNVASLKRTLDRFPPSNQKANFIALGDLNTMGVKPAYNNVTDFDGPQELTFVENRMSSAANGMRLLPKTHTETWWNGKDNWDPSNLDHVFAADHLNFKDFGSGAQIEVSGWVDKTTANAKKNWIDKFSDHSMLYGEIHN
jgi:endonuclease/exonuclease/phosphatase family metal-dependent hydrolase